MLGQAKDSIKLQIGKTYYITKRECGYRCVENKDVKMKLIGIYKYHAVFLNEYGYHESFIYPDLKQVLKVTPVNKPWRNGK